MPAIDGWRPGDTGSWLRLEQRTGRQPRVAPAADADPYLCGRTDTKTFAGLAVGLRHYLCPPDCVTYGLIDTSRGLETTLGYGTIDAARRPAFESAPDWHLVLIGIRDGAADRLRTAIGAVPIDPSITPAQRAVPVHPTGQSAAGQPEPERRDRPGRVLSARSPAAGASARRRATLLAPWPANSLMFSPPSDDAAGHSHVGGLPATIAMGGGALQRPGRRRLAATPPPSGLDRARIPSGERYHELRVCSAGSTSLPSARRPTAPTSGSVGTSTGDDLFLGDTCTRACGFCAVKHRTAHLVRRRPGSAWPRRWPLST